MPVAVSSLSPTRIDASSSSQITLSLSKLAQVAQVNTQSIEEVHVQQTLESASPLSPPSPVLAAEPDPFDL